MRLIYYGDTLQHHGIKGQRWGIRRFQPYPKGHTGGKEVGEAIKNKIQNVVDKSKQNYKERAQNRLLSSISPKHREEERRRKREEEKKKNDPYYDAKKPPKYSRHSGVFDRTVKQGKDKPAISPAEKVANDANKITQEAISGAISILNAKEKMKPKVNKAAKLSDKELRERINRLNMERQYNSLAAEDTSTGYEKTMLALGIIGSVTSIAATTTGIIATIKSIRNGR